MSPAVHRLLSALFLLITAVIAAACSGVLEKQYQYEEEIYLAIDGSVTVNVNASMAALVALRGADVDPDRLARPDRDRVRALFAAPGVQVRTPTFSRRDGRRFVHVSLDAPDVRQLEQLAPFAWSSYRFEQMGDAIVFRQLVGGASRNAVAGVTWAGNELVAFRLHVPSKILFENATTNVQRGNIVAWEQMLTDRLAGTPIEMQVEMEPESILYATLLLFGGTVAAAAVTFAVVVWWVARRGRAAQIAESRS